MKNNTNEAASGGAGHTDIIQFGKGKKNEKGCLVILDEETNSFVDVTPEMQKTAAYVQQQILMGSFITAFGIKKMFDEKLYLGLGCKSRDKYIATQLQIGRSKASKYYKIASKFDSATKLLGGGDLKPIDLSNGSALVQSTGLGNGGVLDHLGLEKLYELSQLEDDEVAELIKKGKVNLVGGELTTQDILESTAREMAKKIAALTKRYQSKISQLSEELKLKESEDKDNQRRMDKLEEENAFAKKIEAQLGDRASLLKTKYERIDEAGKLLIELSMTLRKCGVTPDDPAELQVELCKLLKRIDEVHEEMCVEFGEVVEAA